MKIIYIYFSYLISGRKSLEMITSPFTLKINTPLIIVIYIYYDFFWIYLQILD